MFTGLVETVGAVRSLERSAEGVRLTVVTPLGGSLAAGDSVAVNGVCLTAVEPDAEGFRADVTPETLDRTTLGPLEADEPVNLELPLRATDRLGGHMVQGHIDGLGEVASVEPSGFARMLRVSCGPEVLRYVVAKGSIAVDGVSLTVVDVDADGFSVSLIPETLERTTLGAAGPGRGVNLEVDVLAKYVEKLAAPALGAVAAT